jgi:ketosteroid isomerase-like protein
MMRSPRLLVLFGLAATAYPAAGQVLPFPQDQPAGLDQARYVAEVRRDLQAILGEWVTAWEQGDGEAAAAFVVDDAMVVAPDGALVRGRANVAGFWATHARDAHDMALALTGVNATIDLAAARGRISYRQSHGAAGGRHRTGDVLIIFERQRGVWMQRVFALALEREPQSVVPVMPNAIRGADRPARPPALATIRMHVQPFAGATAMDDAFGGGSAGLAGFALGVEAGGVAELRASYWQTFADLGLTADPLRALAADVRFYAFPDRPLRPFGSAGAARITGAEEEAPGVVPVFGIGLAYAPSERWALDVALRNHFLGDPDAAPNESWLARRTSNWMLSAGIGWSVGRERPWHDPPPTAARLAYQGEMAGVLMGILDRWIAAWENGAAPILAGFYAPASRILAPAGAAVVGPARVADFWAARPLGSGGLLVYEDLRASGGMAAVVARIVPPAWSGPDDDALGIVITVLARQGNGWPIETQLLVETTEWRTGS